VEDEEDENVSIKIDENHTYMIGRYGPVVKYTAAASASSSSAKKKNEQEVTFKKVKPDLDIGKLKRGEYTLNEILSTEANTMSNTKELGKHVGEPVYLKNGQYGFYIQWKDIRKSTSSETIELEEAIKLLSEPSSAEKALLTIVRKIDDNTSIRTGKYGDYIFHKKPTWKSPKFYKLDDFTKDNGKDVSYRSCDLAILSKWVYTKFNL
jgi:DNA topoisomerase-1